MPRSMTPNMLAQITAPSMPPALFAIIPWQGVTQNIWSGVGTITCPMPGSVAYGLPVPSHEWDFVTGTSNDLFGTSNMTTESVSYGAVSGMGSATVGNFNGSSSYAIAPVDSTLEFDGTAPFTVSLWFRQVAGTSTQHLIGNIPAASPNAGWEINTQGTSVELLICNDYATGKYLLATTAAVVELNTTYHLVVTYDGSGKAAGVHIYLNGLSQTMTVASDALESLSSATTSPVLAGARYGGSDYFDGAIAYVQVYGDVDLTPAQVTYLYGLGPVSSSGTSITFTGVGQFGKLSPVTEMAAVNATGTALTLSGVDPTTLANAIDGVNQGNVAQVFLGAVVNGVVVESPVLIYQGLTDQVGIDPGADTATVTLSLESRLSDLQRTMVQKMTDQYQEQKYPGDVCLLAVEKLVDIQLFWGSTG